ncbi:hypothetical protein GCM10017591_26920 [Microbacterium dextranolyticum]|uniref:Signal peptidase I n=1 Tax=Microbacterium dextranolyticum TaxID=36806 RepID=A0A9W6M6M7_9MICO|nr:hypothetical protein GCM10017591_26920 [Microbacterium dextranolyticum]
MVALSAAAEALCGRTPDLYAGPVTDSWGSIESWQAAFGHGTGLVLFLAYYVLLAVAMWKAFSKAGYAGILALIPVVNWFVQVKIAGFSAWLGLLALIPLVNVVFSIIVAIRIGRGFGHGALFSFVLLWLVAPIGYFVIGLGSDRYTRPV